MNEKEIAEIRRRFRPEKSNISKIRGCYVNEKREIISEFHQSFHLTAQAETESILAILKKTLSGAIGKNLIDISFQTQQVVDSEEHKLLIDLRNSCLEDENAIQAFFQRVINALNLEENYLILLTHDTYDVPCYSKDGVKQEDASSEVFSYILCSVCPIKMTKPALSYFISEKAFHQLSADWIVAPPELGFMFPAFDDRSANIYHALYYSRNTAENHKEFVDAIFHSAIPMPAAVQKETFQSILEETLADDCSYEVVQAVHEELCGIILESKSNKEANPPVISKQTVKTVLQSCGVSDSRVSAFEENYDTAFGPAAELCPQNIVDAKQLAVHTPDVTIHVNPERGDLVQTRIIDGAKYILIRADEDVVVNGVQVHIRQ